MQVLIPSKDLINTENRKGDLFLVTSGEYSDYAVRFLCRALVDFDIEKEREEYSASLPYTTIKRRFNEYDFISWLIGVKHFAEEIDYREINFGGAWGDMYMGRESTFPNFKTT